MSFRFVGLGMIHSSPPPCMAGEYCIRYFCSLPCRGGGGGGMYTLSVPMKARRAIVFASANTPDTRRTQALRI